MVHHAWNLGFRVFGTMRNGYKGLCGREAFVQPETLPWALVITASLLA